MTRARDSWTDAGIIVALFLWIGTVPTALIEMIGL